ncbi:MAG: LacI family DNA-binding transcriptional regulator [Victivallales bacterium]|nr:LacI family DNA-binding transcriptional regulator [Victivallales bacterium]
MKKTRLTELAAELGCSVAAVSYALNDRPGVSEELRERVRELVRERNYEPIRPRIAVLMTDAGLSLGFYMFSLLNSLRGEAKRRGHQLLIVSRNDLSLLEDRMVSGALSLDFMHEIGRLFPKLKNMPLVCLNDLPNTLENVSTVHSDDEEGIRRALDYLVDRGHRRIGLFCAASLSGDDRLKPFLAYRRFGTEVELHVEPLEFHHKSTVACRMEAMLEHKVTAILVSGERYGMEAYGALARLGKRIPEDVSVIGWENPGFSEHQIPPMTSLEQDFRGIASAAFDMLEKKIRGEQTGNVFIPYKFHIRGSVRNLK